MVDEIGVAAGKVWEALKGSDGLSLAQLKKKVGGSSDLLNQAVGWLAREGKIVMEKKGNAVKLTLK